MDTLWSSALKELSSCYSDREARAVLRWVMEERFGLDSTDLCLGRDASLSSLQREDFKNILARLKKKEPVQYILGVSDFCGYRLHVAPGVLIPRPETEELVDWVTGDNPSAPLSVLDIGTGSGCIAIAIAGRIPHAAVTAVDISDEALAIARDNAGRLQVDVTFCRHDILTALTEPADAAPGEATTTWDVIVSNPPYIRPSEQASMERNVLDYEPHVALFAPGHDPLLFYRAIARFAALHLRDGGRVYVEINAALGRETVDVFTAAGLRQVVLRHDAYRRPRMIRAIK